jgi:molecular chaperone DnaK
VTAYVPHVDATFEGIFSPRIQTRTPAQLRHEFERERRRLLELEVSGSGDARAQAVIDRIHEEELVEQTERHVAASETDADARAAADRKLLALMSAVDELETALEWPTRVAVARDALRSASEELMKGGTPDERTRYGVLEAEVEAAIRDGRPEVLSLRVEEVERLDRQITWRQPAFWLGFLGYLEEQRESMSDPAQAHRLFLHARRLVQAGDMEGLRSVVIQLHALLPEDRREQGPGAGAFRGTVLPE